MGVPGTDTETGLRQHCTGTIFYVDPNYPGASDARDGTNPTDPMLTVQAALNKCQGYRGDVVVVMANNNWEYDNSGNTTIGQNTIISEQVVMNTPGVRLIGVNQSGVTGVPWLNPASGGVCITVNACNCTVEGFAFFGHRATGLGVAIQPIYLFGTYGDNLTVRHCIFDEYFEYGILMQDAWSCDIHHNWFYATPIGIANDDTVATSIYDHIHHNYFRNCPGCAIYIGLGEHWNVYENHIWNDDAASGSAATDEGIEVAGGDYNFVHHNTMSCLLPGAGAGDYIDFNTGGTNDVWSQNTCANGTSDDIYSPVLVFPTMAAGATIVSAAVNWTLAAPAVIMPAVSAPAVPYLVQALVIESMSKNGEFEFVLYYGNANTEFARVRFSQLGGFFGYCVLQTPSVLIPAGARIYGALACSTGGGGAATATVSIIHRVVPGPPA